VTCGGGAAAVVTGGGLASTVMSKVELGFRI
jgi:hypothetical protein